MHPPPVPELACSCLQATTNFGFQRLCWQVVTGCGNGNRLSCPVRPPPVPELACSCLQVTKTQGLQHVSPCHLHQQAIHGESCPVHPPPVPELACSCLRSTRNMSTKKFLSKLDSKAITCKTGDNFALHIHLQCLLLSASSHDTGFAARQLVSVASASITSKAITSHTGGMLPCVSTFNT